MQTNRLSALGPVNTSNNVEATLSNAASRTILSTQSNVASTNSKQMEHVQFVSTLSKGRNFTKNSFDIVVKKRQQRRSNIVECYNSNDSFDKVECCFDIVAGVDGALEVLSSKDTFDSAICLVQIKSNQIKFICHKFSTQYNNS